MKNALMDTTEDSDEVSSPLSSSMVEMLPKSVEFPVGINFHNQVYTADKIGIDNSGEDMLVMNATGMHLEPGKAPKTIPLAFGTRMPKKTPKSPNEEEKSKIYTEMGTISEFDKKDIKHGFRSTTNELVNKPLSTTTNSIKSVTPITSSKSTLTSNSKRYSREKDIDHIKTLGRTPDIENTTNTIHKQSHSVHRKMDKRDNSEPHKYEQRLSAHKVNNIVNNQDRRIASKSPIRKSPISRSPIHNSNGPNSHYPPRPPMQNSKVQFQNQKGLPPVSHKMLVFDQSTESIEELDEEEKNTKRASKRGNEIVIEENSSGKLPKKGAGKSTLKKEKKQLEEHSENKRKARVPINKRNIESKSKEIKSTTPSTMLLKNQTGGTQLNSFQIKDNAKANTSDNEIEESLICDDTKSIASTRDIEKKAEPLPQSPPYEEEKQENLDTTPQNKKWVITHGLNGFGLEDHKENPKTGEVDSDPSLDSIEDYTTAQNTYKPSQGIKKNDDSFRPFTPPFAQLHSSPTLKKKADLLPPVQDTNKDFTRIEEIYGEEEEQLDLVFDPVLKCYYHPESDTYFQLKNS